MKNKKTYEVPTLMVTEIETEDIMLASSLIGENLRETDNLLGYDTIEIDF